MECCNPERIPTFLHKKSHEMNLKFSHKILLAASGVVVLAFALFTLYTTICSETPSDKTSSLPLNKLAS